jgi:predicted dehydrogenase
MDTIKWGIIGTGRIAAAMAGTLVNDVADAELVAVGSRTQESADRFAATWGIAHAHPSYQALCDDPEVDVIYVATTNDLHHPNTLMAIAAGKHVLCEKPVALNASQAAEMYEAAANAGVFAMEAMWMRFNPFLLKVDELVGAGAIGQLRFIEADFGFSGSADASPRHYLNRFGGGALLDLGVYPLSLAYHLAGPPSEFKAMARLSDEGIDETVTVAARHSGGVMSMLGATLIADTPVRAAVAGTEGRIEVARMFHFSHALELHRDDDLVERFDVGFTGHGFQHEVREVHRCVRAGLGESPGHTHADSLAITGWSDEIRRQVGVRYAVD